jgi:sporulation protein YpjB
MLLNGRIWFLFVVGIMIIVISSCGSNNVVMESTTIIPQSQIKDFMMLTDSAEAMYNHAKRGEYEEARENLELFSDHLTKISFRGITSLEGINATTHTVIEAHKIYNRVQPSEKDALIVATKLRFLADALTHKNKPMWLEYEKVLQNDASQLQGMVDQNNDVGSLAALQKIHNHYLIIRPAVIITNDPVHVEKVDSLFNFLTVELSQGKVNYTNVQQGMKHLHDVLYELFWSKDSQTLVPPVMNQNHVVWTIFIASIIISVLAYVAWRRYKVL